MVVLECIITRRAYSNKISRQLPTLPLHERLGIFRLASLPQSKNAGILSVLGPTAKDKVIPTVKAFNYWRERQENKFFRLS